MENKRKDKRFQEKNEVVIQFTLEHHEGNNRGTKALTHDISLGGARILTAQSFPVDTVMRIEINLSKSKQTIKVDGIVRWIKESPDKDSYELGVEFLHKISKSVLSLIRHLYGEDRGIPSIIS